MLLLILLIFIVGIKTISIVIIKHFIISYFQLSITNYVFYFKIFLIDPQVICFSTILIRFSK
jgi:hypothetical protein